MTEQEQKERLRYLQLKAKAANVSQAPEQEDPGLIESGLRGAAQFGTLGFADEAAGGINAISGAVSDALKSGKVGSIQDLLNKYAAARDAYRKGDDLAWEKHPYAYGTGAVVGGLGSAMIPGAVLGTAAEAGQGARALTQAESIADTLSKAKRLAMFGGIGAAGASKTKLLENVPLASEQQVDDLRRNGIQLAKEVGLGMFTSPGIGIAAEAGIPAAIDLGKRAVAKAGKVGMNAVFGIPEANVSRYLEAPEAVNAAGTREDFAKRLSDVLGSVKEDSGSAAKEMLSALSSERSPRSGFDAESVISKLRSVENPYAQKLADQLEDELAHRINPSKQVYGSATASGPENYLNELEMYKAKRTLSEAADYRNALPDSETARLKMESGDINRILKGANPEYAAAAEKTAERINAKNQLASKFGLIGDPSSPSGLNYTDRTLSGISDLARSNKVERARALELLNKLGYGDLSQEAKDILVKDAFNSSNTNGSRGVNLWKGLAGGVLGHALGIPGAEAIGAMAGATADKYGPAVGKKLLDFGMWTGKVAEPVLDKLPAVSSQQIGEFAAKNMPRLSGMMSETSAADYVSPKQAADEYQNRR